MFFQLNFLQSHTPASYIGQPAVPSHPSFTLPVPARVEPFQSFAHSAMKISTQSLPGKSHCTHKKTHHFPLLWQKCVYSCAFVCAGSCAHTALTNEPSSVKWLVIRTHWLLIASHYHLKVSGGWNQRLWWQCRSACVCVCVWAEQHA